MYILLQQNNMIFKQYRNIKNNYLLNYSGRISSEEIIEWLESSYGISTLNIKIVNKYNEFTIVALANRVSSIYGEFVTFNSILKELDNSKIGLEIKEFIEQQKSISQIKLMFGLRNEKLVSISEISEQEKGLKCNCFCPGCGARLQAKIGSGKKQRHFAHNNETCDIIGAQQTALHLLTKDIIEESGEIFLPPLTVKIDEIPDKDRYKKFIHQMPNEMVYVQGKLVKCESVVLEKRISQIIPDVLVKIRGKVCLIEVAVTHFVDREKKNKIKELGYSTIEIDLSSLYESNYTRENICKIITKDSKYKSWIVNTKKSDAIVWAKKEYDNIFLKLQENENRRKEKIERKYCEKIERQKAAESKFRELIIPEKYKSVLDGLRNDKKFFESLKKRNFYSAAFIFPYFMDIPITGELVFNCDRRIWQSAIFDEFIYSRKSYDGNEPVINVYKIYKWATTYQNIFKLNWSLMPKIYIQIKNSGYRRSLLFECIKQYLEYLHLLGFISEICNAEAKVLLTQSLSAPNKREYIELKGILNKLDNNIPNITDQIYVMLNPDKVAIGMLNDLSEESIQQQKKIQFELSANNIYEEGLKEVVSNNSFSNEDIVKDSFDKRWLICTECGQIKREDEMAIYSGKTGTCRESCLSNRK